MRRKTTIFIVFLQNNYFNEKQKNRAAWRVSSLWGERRIKKAS